MFLLSSVLFTSFIGALCDVNNIISPCPRNDNKCVTKVSASAFRKLCDGVPSLGIESSDPLFVDLIVGDLSTLKFELENSTITGYKNCNANKVTIDWDSLKMHVELSCQDIKAFGDYKLGGRLLLLPVEGDGQYKLNIKRYEIVVDLDLKEIEDNEGVKHLHMKKYKVNAHAEDGVHYDFSNLFNGNDDLGNTVLTFANQNWREVADIVQGPVLASVMKKFIARGNKFLKSVPIEDLTV